MYTHTHRCTSIKWSCDLGTSEMANLGTFDFRATEATTSPDPCSLGQLRSTWPGHETLSIFELRVP